MEYTNYTILTTTTTIISTTTEIKYKQITLIKITYSKPTKNFISKKSDYSRLRTGFVDECAMPVTHILIALTNA